MIRNSSDDAGGVGSADNNSVDDSNGVVRKHKQEQAQSLHYAAETNSLDF